MDGAAVFQSDSRSADAREDARESVEKPRQESSQGPNGTNENGSAKPTNVSGRASGAETPPPEGPAGAEADLLGQDPKQPELPEMSVIDFAIQPPVQDSAVATVLPAASSSPTSASDNAPMDSGSVTQD